MLYSLIVGVNTSQSLYQHRYQKDKSEYFKDIQCNLLLTLIEARAAVS